MNFLSYKTVSANKNTVTKNWVVVDANAQVLGRLASKVASKPPLATQGTVKAVWQSLDSGLSSAIDRAMLYIQVNNLSDGQIDRSIAKKTDHEVR